METNETLFRDSRVMQNEGTKPANDFKFFGFSFLATLEATHDVLHDAPVLIA